MRCHRLSAFGPQQQSDFERLALWGRDCVHHLRQDLAEQVRQTSVGQVRLTHGRLAPQHMVTELARRVDAFVPQRRLARPGLAFDNEPSSSTVFAPDELTHPAPLIRAHNHPAACHASIVTRASMGPIPRRAIPFAHPSAIPQASGIQPDVKVANSGRPDSSAVLAERGSRTVQSDGGYGRQD